MKTAQGLNKNGDKPDGMVNENHEPDEREEKVLTVLKREKRANPMLIREETGLNKGHLNIALNNLMAAGWVEKVTRGLYDFVEDPRKGASETNTESSDDSNDSDRDNVYDPTEEFE